MKCPNDNATLLITERSGIEIDYCPECRGVWLDRGELDKIIDKNMTAQPIPSQPQDFRLSSAERPKTYDDDYEKRRSSYDDYDKRHYKKHRKESFLGDLFDF